MAKRSHRPKGSSSTSSARDPARVETERRLQASADPIAEKLIDEALSGDMAAARIILDKALAEPGDRQIPFPLRQISNKKDAELAMIEVLTVAAEGRMTPAEGRAVIKQLVEFIRAPATAGESVFMKAAKYDLVARNEWFRMVGERLRALTEPTSSEAKVANDRAENEQSDSCSFSAPARATTAAERRLQDAVQSVAAAVIDAAMAGDVTAQKLALEKALRKPADRTISFPIRRIRSKQDAEATRLDVLNAMAEGRMTPAEADAFLKLLGDVIGAPEVPKEAIDSEQLEEAVRRLIPELMSRAAEREKESLEGQRFTPYHIWLDLSDYMRTKLLGLLRPGRWTQ